jgi:transposase-like protein
MLNCEQATRLQSDAMERPLSMREKMALKMHTTICSACRQFGRQVGTLRDLTRQYRDRPDQKN